MKVRKITSLILCTAITANLLVSSASAYSEAGESRVYTYNGYTVEYKIVNEWTGNQNIEITVTNTGDEILADWAMGYNASGEINGLWNAQIYGQQARNTFSAVQATTARLYPVIRLISATH